MGAVLLIRGELQTTEVVQRETKIAGVHGFSTRNRFLPNDTIEVCVSSTKPQFELIVSTVYYNDQVWLQRLWPQQRRGIFFTVQSLGILNRWRIGRLKGLKNVTFISIFY